MNKQWAALAEGKYGIFHNRTLQKIGRKHGKSIAQVVLRWDIDRGLIPLAKSVKEQRMRENINILDFKLSQDDVETINQLNLGQSLWPNY